MHEYRIYTLNDDNRIAGPGVVAECPSDDVAITAAKAMLNGHAVEVWQGTRVVIRLNPTDDK
jgi:hypothetical protein